VAYWLATPSSARAYETARRFDPRFWTVNFPRPMMASVTSPASDALRVDAVFYKKNDLAGLIWDSVDSYDHALLAYKADRDYRNCQLSFRWRSSGVKKLDVFHGPTLTIEGRDQAGNPRSWFVRIWNYAVGDPDDAVVTINFNNLAGGFLHPSEADPVWAGDIDRMFFSLVAPGYDQSDAPLAARAEGWVEVSQMVCTGARSFLTLGETSVVAHDLRMATGFDDLYHLTPDRVLRNIYQLGYREVINHYVGMSHYFRLEELGGGYYISLAGGVLNVACSAWHQEFAARAHALGFGIIWSLSYELLDQHCWNDWKQRTEAGAPALTGWDPPSTLLSPAHSGAMGYLRQVGQAFASIAVGAGMPVRFQVGEPWWWIFGDGRICLYDAATVAAISPVSIADVRSPSLSAPQKATLDAAGTLLAQSTADLNAAVRVVAPSAESLVLVFLPTVLDGADVKRANVPVEWASPAFDVLQLEDYDWITSGNGSLTAGGIAAVTSRLGYPIPDQHYFAGFVLLAADKEELWPAITTAAEAGFFRTTAEVFVWALPQVMRDSYTWFDAIDPVRRQLIMVNAF
jgi:hypothetical protein